MLDVAIWSEIYTLFEPLPCCDGSEAVLQLLQGGPQCQMHFYVLAEKSSTTDFFRNKWVMTCINTLNQTHFLSYNPQTPSI